MGIENELVYIDLGRNYARTYRVGVNNLGNREIVIVDPTDRRGFYQVVVIERRETGNPGILVHEGIYQGEILTINENLLALAERS